MSDIETLKRQHADTLAATAGGPPPRTSNPFFGVGPITDAVADEVEARRMRFAFEHWLEENYRKLDDTGKDLGPYHGGGDRPLHASRLPRRQVHPRHDARDP